MNEPKEAVEPEQEWMKRLSHKQKQIAALGRLDKIRPMIVPRDGTSKYNPGLPPIKVRPSRKRGTNESAKQKAIETNEVSSTKSDRREPPVSSDW